MTNLFIPFASLFFLMSESRDKFLSPSISYGDMSVHKYFGLKENAFNIFQVV